MRLNTPGHQVLTSSPQTTIVHAQQMLISSCTVHCLIHEAQLALQAFSWAKGSDFPLSLGPVPQRQSLLFRSYGADKKLT